MLAHSSSTWPFPLPLWVHKSSICTYIICISTIFYIYFILFHKFLNVFFYLTRHSDFNLQRTSVRRCPSKPPGGQSIRKVNFCCGTTSASPCQPRNGSKLFGSQQTTKTYTTWFKTYKIQNQNDYCEDNKDLQ